MMSRPTIIAGEPVNNRVPVTTPTRNLLRDFCQGAGVTYSEGIRYLIEQVRRNNESVFSTGVRMRDVIRGGDANGNK